MEDVEGELSKTKAELNRTIGDHMRLKEEVASKEQKLQGTIAKQEEQISSLKLQCEQLKNQVCVAGCTQTNKVVFTVSHTLKKSKTYLSMTVAHENRSAPIVEVVAADHARWKLFIELVL